MVLFVPSMNPKALLDTVAFAVIFALVMSLHARRQAIAHRLWRIVKAEAIFLAVTVILLKVGEQPLIAAGGGILCALLFDRSARPRSRRIPTAERRKAIARFELTGQKYNRKKHDLGHIVPFAGGGSNTADNLEVEDRRRNRSKGAKSPWWDLLGGRRR